MNRPAVYSYLTRYPYGTGCGRPISTLVSMLFWGHGNQNSTCDQLILEEALTTRKPGQLRDTWHKTRQDSLSRIWRRAVTSPSQIITRSRMAHKSQTFCRCPAEDSDIAGHIIKQATIHRKSLVTKTRTTRNICLPLNWEKSGGAKCQVENWNPAGHFVRHRRNNFLGNCRPWMRVVARLVSVWTNW